MEKLITFLVPCYNSQDYMEKCIDSLIPAGECAEVLIVNDGSTDRTGEIAAGYEKRYPEICRVLTQENGGHGAGINHGLAEAKGRYFKVVDSDDWVDGAALDQVIDTLRNLENAGGVDLLFCNYVYDNVDPSLTKTVDFSNVFPQGHVFDWDEVGRFRLWQYLFMHACIHRTRLLRDCGLVLPEHTFYEDELFSYFPLPNTHRLYYLKVDFYHYMIGRAGQSVAEDVMAKRHTHQMRVSCAMFRAFDPLEIKKTQPQLGRYLIHDLMFCMALATVFTRLNRSKEADGEAAAMWRELKKENPRLAGKMRWRTWGIVMNLPGAFGRSFAIGCYHACHKFIAFN